MNFLSDLHLPAHSFLSDVQVVDNRDGCTISTGNESLDALSRLTIESCRPIVEKSVHRIPADASAVMTIPVFLRDEIVSVVILVATRDLPSEVDVPEPVGVLEVWEPMGAYDELALSAGYYGKMERFQNVSSFVRFERGNGLPGQVWERAVGVIHDDLGNHPGFLRAAGASADLLQTAVGIPVFDGDFLASVLLISSHRTPIARAFEVWHRCETGFAMLGGSYVDFDESFSLRPGTTLGTEEGWAGAISSVCGAVVSSDPSVLFSGRCCDQQISDTNCLPGCGIAIPRFDDVSLDSFVILYP